MTTFVTRAEWGSRYGTAGYHIGQVNNVVAHHTPGQDGCGDYDTAAQEVRNIEHGHVTRNGWSAIGYTWLVSGDYAFEGRGYGRSGAHAPGANSTSIGIAFILDGRDRAPTPTEWQTAAAIVRRAIDEGHLSPTWYETGHRDWISTECPASLIYGNLGSLRAALDWPNVAPTPPLEEDFLTNAEAQKMLEELHRGFFDIDPYMRQVYNQTTWTWDRVQALSHTLRTDLAARKRKRADGSEYDVNTLVELIDVLNEENVERLVAAAERLADEHDHEPAAPVLDVEASLDQATAEQLLRALMRKKKPFGVDVDA